MRRTLLLVLALFMSPLAMAEQEMSAVAYDPWEGFNRASWNFNYNYLDKPLFRPVTHTYVEHVPFGIRDAFNNMLRNLEEPASFVNHLLQGDVDGALNSLVRFVFNSTFGLAGAIDIIGEGGTKRDIAEFSDVLGFYGVSNGPYLMLPVLGPSTVRNQFGDIVDSLMSPLGSLSLAERAGAWALDGLYARSQVIDQEPLLDSSLDSYNFVKDAYWQFRRYRFYNGNPPSVETDFDDEDFDSFLDEIDAL